MECEKIALLGVLADISWMCSDRRRNSLSDGSDTHRKYSKLTDVSPGNPGSNSDLHPVLHNRRNMQHQIQR